MGRYNERWWPRARDFSQNWKLMEGGPALGKIFEYVLRLAFTTSDDGWIERSKITPERVWHGLGYEQSKYTKEEIADAMNTFWNLDLVKSDGDFVSPVGLNKFKKDIERKVEREKKRGQRRRPDNKEQLVPDKSRTSPGQKGTCPELSQSVPFNKNITEHNNNIYISSFEHESTSKTNDVYDNNTNNEVGEDTLGGMTGEEIKTLFDGKMAALAWTILDGWNQYPPHSCLETAVQLGAYWNGKLTIKNMVDITEKAIASWPPGRSLHQGNGLHGFISSFFSNEHERISRGRH